MTHYPPPPELPQHPGYEPADYPATLTINVPERITRWRPLVQWFLVIPHLILLGVLGAVASVCVFIAWFCGVILGSIPATLLNFTALTQRYGNRVSAYSSFMTDVYPPFSLDARVDEPGDYPLVRNDFALQTEGRSRLTIFFRFLLIIPHVFALWALFIVAGVLYFVAFFAVLILGRWPAGIRDFILGVLRWANRVNAYANLLVDDYPPFSMN